jgi:aspartate aminotransferase
VKNVTPSLTLEITSLAKKMRQEGHKVINFAAGEPDFDTPDYIKKAAIKGIKEGFTKYTPATGWPELKKAISEKLQRDNQLDYPPSRIIVGCGAKHILYNIIQALCEETDEVLIVSPYWISYPEMITLAGAKARVVQTSAENGFKADAKAIESRITPKTRLLILNSPSNPAGCVYSRRELEAIAEVVVRKDLYVISDEIYEELIFDKKSHVSFASLNQQARERAIVVNGVSKSYAMTGWRIGYMACADEGIVKAVGNLQSHSTSNPCSISQMAAKEALTRPEKARMPQMLKEFQARRDCMLKGLSRIESLSFVKPEGAFYVFCNISKSGLDSVTFASRLLKEAKVAVIPGKPFGRDDYIRLSFATSREQISEGMSRLQGWVEKNK